MGSKRQQVHFVISEADLQFLRSLALKYDETVAAILRRAVRGIRRQYEAAGRPPAPHDSAAQNRR